MWKSFLPIVMLSATLSLNAHESRVQETEDASLGSKLVFEGYKGHVTKNEIAAFKAHIASVPAPATHDRNVMVYGNPGKMLEACGLVYEFSNDREILNRMVYYTDAAMAGRNDIEKASNGGQRILWTGKIEPVWPSSLPSVSPADAGIATGSVLAHILYTAKLILADSSIWSFKPLGELAINQGKTYKQCADYYVREADLVMDRWILPNYIRDDKKIYFPAPPNFYKPNEAAPWNQLFMLTNGLIRSSECHMLLKDYSDRVKNYDEIVKVNIDWFKENVQSYKSPLGSTVWKFKYALTSRIEDKIGRAHV